MQAPGAYRIGKYVLEQNLGGGMADVYRAQDTVMDRTVVVKILKERGCADPEAKTRFLQEARLAGKLDHPNIVRIFDYGEDDQQRSYMVMEFLRGDDLNKTIKAGRIGDLSHKLRLAWELAGALEYIHSQGIIHRDIKPENIHVTEAGSIKLMDFGIAKTASMSLTQTGMAVGSPPFMAPEQIRGEKASGQVDVYAFGVVLYELLTGIRAFRRDTIESLFYAILNEPLNDEPLLQQQIPERLRKLVLRCVSKRPEERPNGFGEVRQELSAILDESGFAGTKQATVRAPLASRGPARRTAIFAGAAIICIVAIALVVLSRQRRPALTGNAQQTVAPAGMVLVPGGTFQFGRDRRATTIPDFYIDRTEVPNSAFAEFCRAASRPLPPGFPKNSPDLPVVNITFDEASAFAKWAGKSLPDMKQWEKAARGTDGRTYPWGEAADLSRANVASARGNPGRLLAVVGFQNGASPFGTLQMVGNAWEFVNEAGKPSREDLSSFARQLSPAPAAAEPWVHIRGGSFGEPLDPNVLWDSNLVPARLRSKYVGFRCVRNPQ